MHSSKPMHQRKRAAKREAGECKRVERVAIIGYGAIGSEIGKGLESGAVPNHRLLAIMTRSPPESSLGKAVHWTAKLDELLALAPDIVIEAAGAEVLRAVAIPVLRSGVDLMALSVAAFANRDFQRESEAALTATDARLFIPSGAMAGLDAISAAMSAGVTRVAMTQRKPPAALLSPEEARNVTAEMVLSQGSAREAALKLPKNSNIAAALALCGPGLDNVTVRVVADPSVTRNTMELLAEGVFGTLFVKLENEPTDNKRTSRLTAMSVIASLKRRTGKFICPA